MQEKNFSFQETADFGFEKAAKAPRGAGKISPAMFEAPPSADARLVD